MKKYLILLSLLLIFGSNASFASEISAEINNRTVQVYSEKASFGIKDKSENILVKAQYKKLVRLGTNAWIVQKRNKFGVIDCTGNILVPIKYSHVERIINKLVKLGNDKDYGVYNEFGDALIPPEYSELIPISGEMFITFKNFKYGIIDFNGNVVLDNEFDYIYMPDTNTLRILYEGNWFEIVRSNKNSPIEIPTDSAKITINNDEFIVTKIVLNTGVVSGYSFLTATDYFLKIFSSISPAYEKTIDEIMLSQGADTVNIITKASWIPKFPYIYVKKYYENLRTPNNSPLADIRNDMRSKIK